MAGTLEGTLIASHYQIGRLIGQGGMASVYEAIDTRNGGKVAVKFLRPNGPTKGFERLQREAAHLASMDHPSIVRLHQVDMAHDPPCIVMELVGGDPLHTWWAHHTSPTVDALLDTFDRLLDALAYAHNRGLIHRDVKPGNVRVAESGDIKLLDFGLSSLTTGQARLTAEGFIGTLRYLAPERANGARGDARCDVYSVGIMLYNMLTQHWPYDQQDPYQHLLRQMCTLPPPPSRWVPSLPPWLDAEVLRALDGRIERRHESAGVLRDALRQGRTRDTALELDIQVSFPEGVDAEPPIPTLLHEAWQAHRQGDEETVEKLHRELVQLQSEVTETVASFLPIAQAAHFQGRVEEMTRLRELLEAPENRVVVVSGRGGMGKTSLVTRVLAENRSLAAHVVYHRLHRSEAHPADRILELVYRLMPAARASTLRERLRDAALPKKLAVLDEELTHLGPTLVVVDNLEECLDEDGHLTGDMKHFIEHCGSSTQAPRVLASTRRSPQAPSQLAELPMLEGLSHDEAVAMLRHIDFDGRLGVADVPPEALGTLVSRAHGLPRTLETMVGLLQQAGPHSLRTLAADTFTLDRLVEDPARELYDSLPPGDQLAMQALALYNHPVPLAAIRFMVPGLPVEACLARLLASFVVRNERDRWFLHPLDREHALRRLPERGGDYSRQAWHQRAADFWRQLQKPANTWHSLLDIEPQLEELHHLIEGGNPERATLLMDSIDADHLSLWGYHARVAALRQRLKVPSTEPELACSNLTALGLAQVRMGDPEVAVETLTAALELAQRLEHPGMLGRALGALGMAHEALGEANAAVEALNKGLSIAKQLKDQAAVASLLGTLGDAWDTLGDLTRAVQSHEEALRLARSVGDKRQQAHWLDQLASNWATQGDLGKAEVCWREALSLAETLGDQQAAAESRGQLGRLLLLGGKAADAIPWFEQAVALAQEIEDRPAVAGWLYHLGDAHHAQGERSAAARFYNLARDKDAMHLGASSGFRLGVLALEEGRRSDSVALFAESVKAGQRLLHHTPHPYETMYRLALALAAQGSTEEALALCHRAVEMCSATGEVNAMLRELGLLQAAAPTLAALAPLRERLQQALPAPTAAPAPLAVPLVPLAVTTRDGTRDVPPAEWQTLRANKTDFEIWIDEVTPEIWEKTHGSVDFGHRRILSKLLFHLMGSEHDYSADELMKEVWEVRRVLPSDQHTVRVAISRLRQLLEPDAAHPRYIQKRGGGFGRGAGYFFSRDCKYAWIHPR